MTATAPTAPAVPATLPPTATAALPAAAPAPPSPRRPRIRRLAHEPEAVVMPAPRRADLPTFVHGEVRPWTARTEPVLAPGDSSPPDGAARFRDGPGPGGATTDPAGTAPGVVDRAHGGASDRDGGASGPLGGAPGPADTTSGPTGDTSGPSCTVVPPGVPLPGRAGGPVAVAGATPEVQRLATVLVRRMVEVLAGRRAPDHLARAAQPQVVRYLTVSRDSGRATRQVTPPRRVHVSQPTPDSAEITAVCRFGPRARALTVRLDRERATPHPGWQASAVRLL